MPLLLSLQSAARLGAVPWHGTIDPQCPGVGLELGSMPVSILAELRHLGFQYTVQFRAPRLVTGGHAVRLSPMPAGAVLYGVPKCLFQKSFDARRHSLREVGHAALDRRYRNSGN